MYIFKTFDGKKYGTAYNSNEVGVLLWFYAIRLNPFMENTEVVLRDNVDLNSFKWDEID